MRSVRARMANPFSCAGVVVDILCYAGARNGVTSAPSLAWEYPNWDSRPQEVEVFEYSEPDLRGESGAAP